MNHFVVCFRIENKTKANIFVTLYFVWCSLLINIRTSLTHNGPKHRNFNLFLVNAHAKQSRVSSCTASTLPFHGISPRNTLSLFIFVSELLYLVVLCDFFVWFIWVEPNGHTHKSDRCHCMPIYDCTCKCVKIYLIHWHLVSVFIIYIIFIY